MAGPPKVICSICNQEVLKSQTYFIGDGKRACKSHDGICEKSIELKSQELREKESARISVEDKRRKDREYWQRKNQPMFETVRLATGEVKVHRCWCCNDRGIMLSDLLEGKLIAMHRMKLKKIEFNPFLDQGKICEELRLPKDMIVVNMVEVVEDSERNRVERLLLREYRGALVDLLKMVCVCEPCAKKLNLKFTREDPKPLSKEALDTMMVLGALMEPVLDEMAQKTIEVDKNTN